MTQPPRAERPSHKRLMSAHAHHVHTHNKRLQAVAEAAAAQYEAGLAADVAASVPSTTTAPPTVKGSK